LLSQSQVDNGVDIFMWQASELRRCRARTTNLWNIRRTWTRSKDRRRGTSWCRNWWGGRRWV